MAVEVLDGVPVVRKHPDTSQDQQRLARERAWLVRGRHPGIVAVVATDGGGDLVTRRVGHDLDQRGDLEAPALAGVGAAAATVLADLHDLGIAHGRPTADHILLDDVGRPVLCGLGDARPVDPAAEARDVRILAGALFDHLAEPAPRRLRQLLERAASSRRPLPARTFAGRLAGAVPDPRLPRAPAAAGAADTTSATGAGASDDASSAGVEPSESALGAALEAEAAVAFWAEAEGAEHAFRRRAHGRRPARRARQTPPERSRPRFHRWLAAFVGIPVVVGLVGAAAHWAAPALSGGPAAAAAGPTRTTGPIPSADPAGKTRAAGSPRSDPAQPSRTTPSAAPVSGRELPCPATDDGCGPLALKDGAFAFGGRRWILSAHGDVVVVGRWTCHDALPAALDPANGAVWTFTAWSQSVGRLVTTVPGASSLAVRPGGDGCDRLDVLVPGHRSVVIRPATAPAGRV